MIIIHIDLAAAADAAHVCVYAIIRRYFARLAAG